MKYLVRLGFVLFALLIVGLALLLTFPSDVVTSRYATLQAAREDHLFGRGWLPEILPPSAFNIRVSNNLDLNTSEGEFSFNPVDYSVLTTYVRPYRFVGAPFLRFEETVAHMGSRGYESRVYEGDDSTWVFFCKATEGYCEYTMWLRRD